MGALNPEHLMGERVCGQASIPTETRVPLAFLWWCQPQPQLHARRDSTSLTQSHVDQAITRRERVHAQRQAPIVPVTDLLEQLLTLDT